MSEPERIATPQDERMESTTEEAWPVEDDIDEKSELDELNPDQPSDRPSHVLQGEGRENDVDREGNFLDHILLLLS